MMMVWWLAMSSNWSTRARSCRCPGSRRCRCDGKTFASRIDKSKVNQHPVRANSDTPCKILQRSPVSRANAREEGGEKI
ncbi:hypothetical protein C8J55DRAFT_523155, partial [Lentinula edodes]